jgi:TonB-linked SusC/RagA family outer membrane protein
MLDFSVCAKERREEAVPQARTGATARLLALLSFSLVLGVFALPLGAQQGGVAGVVSDDGGQPLSGVRVSVDGTNVATATNVQGRFDFTSLPSAQVTLRFARIGYRTITREVRAGDMDVRVTLPQAAISIDEIVVTGTVGAQARREIGNSVTAIQAEDVAQIARIPDVSSYIVGRSPGVEVRATSSQVGAGPQVRIRGVSSFSLSTQPLIYIDGVRVDNSINSGIAVQGFGGAIFSRLNDINPEEIESIEIIKGPAAATLYGTEASNGVIQIITKRGRAGTPEWSVSTRQGQWAFRNPEGRLIQNWGRPLSVRGVVRSDINVPYPADDEPFQFDLFANERSLGNKIVTTGHGQGYDVSLRGGTAATRYYLGLGFERDNGIEPMNQANKFNLRTNVTVSPTDNLDITANVGYVNSKTNVAPENAGIWFGFFFHNPSANNPGPSAPLGISGPRRGWWSAPPEFQYMNRETYQALKKQTVGITLNHRPTDWLTLRAVVGQDQSFTEDTNFRGNTPELIPYFGETSAQGFRFIARNNVESTTFDGSATAAFDLNEDWSSATTLGAQHYRRSISLQSATGNRFPAPGLEVVAAAEERLGFEDYIENHTLGVFGQQQFSMKGRLFLTTALRIDDNSAFGSDFSFTTYPKASVSWVINEEPFFDYPWVDELKLRAAYGAAGQQPDNFAALRTLQPVVGGAGGALTPQFIGNEQLKPEKGTEFEIGFEAGLLENRLGLDFTFYRARTKDAILNQQLAPSLGFPGAQFVNAGSIQNQGIELQVRTLAVRRPGLGVDFTLNLSTNDNKVLDLGGVDQGQGFLPAGSQRQVPGFSTGAWFREVAVSAEIGQDGRAFNVMCDGGNPNGRLLPDGTPLEQGGPAVPCAGAPMLYLGRSVPSFEGSIGSTVTIRQNLRLYAMLDWRDNWYKFDNNLRVRCQVLFLCEETYYPERFVDAPSHFRNSSGAAYIAEIQSPGSLVSHVINDASMLRLREVSASYDLPREWASRFRAGSASVSLAARNLYHWSPYTSLDPEAQFTAPVGTAATEQNQPPPLFSYMLTFRATF